MRINDVREVAPAGIIEARSLREQVYEYLRSAMNNGALGPDAAIDMRALSAALGVSKTPLRDALLQLASEGFVTILPRRGIRVNSLTLDDIRHLYEIIGALEGVVVVSVHPRLTREHFRHMKRLNAAMRAALREDDFDRFYEHNLAFHDVFLDLSNNAMLVRMVRTLKHRLYDFPRRRGFVKEWEVASTGEHAAFVAHLERGDAAAAADYWRDVHWSFEVQEKYIRRYYFASRQNGGGGEPGRER